MPISEVQNRPHLTCKRCGAVLVLPVSLDEAAKHEVAEFRQSDQIISAMDCLRRKHHLDLAEAKAVALHIPLHSGVCHRCRGPVVGGDSVCPKCHCVNLNWIGGR